MLSRSSGSSPGGRTSIALSLLAVIGLVTACAPKAPSAADHPDGGSDPAATAGGGGAGSGGDGSGPQGPSGDQDQTLPCDVDSVLGASCRNCHGSTPAYGAPMSLVTYEDLMAPSPTDKSTPVYKKVLSRVQSEKSPMPPSPAAPLDAGAISTLEAWVNAGAPTGPACGGGGSGGGGSDGGDTGTGSGEPELPCTPDTLVRAPAPYTLSADSDNEYVCFGFTVDLAKKRHVIGLAPHVDNKAVVHHILLFQTNQAVSPTPKPCSAFGSASWRLISGWAPGGQPLVVPAEAGFPEEQGKTHWVAQIHYHNGKQLPGLQDQSGYDLCTTEDLRPNDADVMAPGSINFTIDPFSKLSLTCDHKFTEAKSIHVFGASPHMHTLGTAMSTVKISGNVMQTVHDQPSFDFQSQLNYPVSVDVGYGDTLRTRCVWQNTTPNTVHFGENTEDEMCFDFLAYYPKIKSPLFSWMTPSLVASCKAE
jgi:hypothetical protein